MKELPYAEELNFWKTSKSSADKWLNDAEDIIAKFGGTVTLRAKGRAGENQAYAFQFSHNNDRFKILYPVLPTKNGDVRSAERQCCQFIFYEVKNRSIQVKIFGFKSAYFEFLMLEDGQTVREHSTDMSDMVKLLTS